MNEREIAMVCAQLGRRQVLKAFAGAVGGVALTACGGGGGAVSASMPSLAGVRTDSVLTTGGGASRNLTTTQNPPPDEPVERVSTNTENKLQISLPSGSQTNYPLQFGRAFPKGAISGAPSVALDGVTLAAQQADVKTRYDDGSVKFAVISVVIPSLGTSERVLSIMNKAAGTAPAAETRANMLANYDFEATIGVSVGGTQVAGAPVSARAMLAASSDSSLAAETTAGGVNSRYWTVGPVCTTVLLCDHTTKAWDIGTNATKAIRPMFHVQFWPTLGKYHVRHILEVADVTKLKDETGLGVTFTTGQAAPVVRLSQSGVALYGATFQSRSYWGGAEVPRANANHGLAYMSSTMAMPNHDPSITILPATLTSYANDWAIRDKSLGAGGYWQKAMPTGGGRQDLGLMPKWDVVALYAGTAAMHRISEENAELAGSWAMYFREGSATKNIFGATPGRGRIVSKVSRPMQFMYDGNAYMVTSGADGFSVDGSLTQSGGGWLHDSAHTPGMFWFNYLTTGSAFWHEKLIQMAAWGQWLVNPGYGFNGSANGADSTSIILNGVQSRGWGWQIRNRARAWWASLDGSPERSLMDKSITDAAAHRAGLYDVPGFMVGHPVRDAWNTNHAVWYSGGSNPPRPNALNYFEPRGPYNLATVENIGSGVAPNDYGDGAQAPWMLNYIVMSIYHAVELGRTDIKPLADWIALPAIAVAGGPHYRHLSDYIIPAIKNTGAYYQTLDDIYDGWSYLGSLQPEGSGFSGAGFPTSYQVSVEDYGAIAATGIAMANGAPGRDAAWARLKPYHDNTLYFNHDPRYAIVPRV